MIVRSLSELFAEARRADIEAPDLPDGFELGGFEAEPSARLSDD